MDVRVPSLKVDDDTKAQHPGELNAYISHQVILGNPLAFFSCCINNSFALFMSRIANLIVKPLSERGSVAPSSKFKAAVNALLANTARVGAGRGPL